MPREVVQFAQANTGFVLLPKRWVVERSTAWAVRWRRLARDDARLAETRAGLHDVAFAILMRKRCIARIVSHASHALEARVSLASSVRLCQPRQGAPVAWQGDWAGTYGEHNAMKTLLLNPPSFPQFDGGAGSRWPATREITSFWYPVWLAYPAGMIPESRLLDAPPHGITPEETIVIASQYDFVTLYTSTVGWQNDVQLAEMMKTVKPALKIAFVGPPVTVQPEEALQASPAIDFVIRKEIDYPLAEFAAGKSLAEIAGVSFKHAGKVIHNPPRPLLQDLDALPFASEVYKRDLDITKYNVPFLLHPYIAFYTSRGCPALCTFCLWPQTISGHAWRTRSIANVVDEVRRTQELFPDLQEIFFDDDTFAWGKRRTLALCEALQPLQQTWSC